jgi:predicted nucleotidyltransferase
MRTSIVLASALLCFTGLLAQAKQPAVQPPQKLKHPHLHHAYWALHFAHHELKMSPEEFGGHKQKALHAIERAMHHIKEILVFENDQLSGTPNRYELSELQRKYKHHPYLHHALHQLKSAHHQMKESKTEFGGLRVKALHEMDHAIHQIELVLKHARQADRTNTTTR